MRSALFGLFGIGLFIPVIVLYATYDPVYSLPPDFGPFAWPCAVYLLGVIFYVTQIPERWNPGKFDRFGASHQIFHVTVLIGIALTLTASFKTYEDRLQFTCPDQAA